MNGDDLINFGLNFGFYFVVFGILSALICCFYKTFDSVDVDHENGSSDEHHHHVIITIKELDVGLEPSVIRSIPVVDFNSKDFKDGVECVVCLSELSEGDKARVLPSCNHSFHADCIDSWFQSHSTCPLCRKRVSSAKPRTTEEGLTQNHKSVVFPTSPPTSPNTVVIEDHTSEEASEVQQDLTDIPAKPSGNISTK